MAVPVLTHAPATVLQTRHINDGTCFSCKPGWTGKFCKTSMNFLTDSLHRHDTNKYIGYLTSRDGMIVI